VVPSSHCRNVGGSAEIFDLKASGTRIGTRSNPRTVFNRISVSFFAMSSLPVAPKVIRIWIFAACCHLGASAPSACTSQVETMHRRSRKGTEPCHGDGWQFAVNCTVPGPKNWWTWDHFEHNPVSARRAC
jgi:hypothetical protein